LKNWILYFLLFGFVYGQDSLDSLFNAGNQYYEAGDYVNAISFYEKLGQEVNLVDVFYNMGNAYYRSGNLGNSIWAWEKARKISPRNKDILHNLSIGNSKVKDRIEPPEDLLLLKIYRSFIEKSTVQDLLRLGSLLLLLLSIAYGLGRLKPRLQQRLGPIKILLLTGIIIMHFLALDRYWDLSEIKAGIVVVSRADVRSAPIIHPQNVIFRIHEGAKVEITQSQTGWIEIILLDGKKGWLISTAVRNI